jgi:cell division protein FtsA
MSVLQIEEKEATDILVKYGNAYVNSEDEISKLTQNSYTTSNKEKVPMTKIQHIIEARLIEIMVNAVVQVVNSGYADQLLAGLVITGGGSNIKNIDKAFQNNPRKRFESIRVAKKVITPTVKSTQAAALDEENGMSGSIISLMLAGTENCVGEGSYSGVDIFTSAKIDENTRTNVQTAETERKKIENMMMQLEDYKDRIRSAVNKIRNIKQDIENDTANKRLREEGLRIMNEASEICGNEFHNIVDSLEVKLKNDQRIASAVDLEVQLQDELEALKDTINVAKEDNSFFKKVSQWLKKVVNED